MYRVGIGHDTHRLQPGGPLHLAGTEVPHAFGCDAHSDGDVVLHALIDAILGALSWGDIGEWFPDSDPQWAGVDSGGLLEQVMAKVSTAGWTVGNADCIIFAQQPKLSPMKDGMRTRLAQLLRIPNDRVSIKAKTGEQVGPIGREEAISAQAVVLLEHTGSATERA